MSNGEGHWAEGVEHPSITAENRESFNKAMGKYETPEDAHVGLLEAQKVIGAPFKLPESMDKLPDDKTKAEFMSGVNKLTGVVESEEQLKDFPWTKGMAEGGQADETMVNTFKQFLFKNPMPRTTAENAVELWNTANRQARESHTQALKQQVTETNQKLSQAFGGDENYKVQKELFKRTLQNKSGLTPEEAGQLVNDLFDENGNIVAVNPLFTKAIITAMAPLSKQGSTEGGEGGEIKEKEKEKSFGEKEGLEKTTKALWGE